MADLLPRIYGSGGKGQPAPATVIVQQGQQVAQPRAAEEEANTLFSKAKARIVFAISEGPIKGFVSDDPLKDIYLDGTPIKSPDGTLNFRNVGFDWRAGYDTTQTPMSGFNTAERLTSVGVPLTRSDGPVVRTVDTRSVDRLRVIISSPSLQATDTANNITRGTSVQFRIETSANNGPWVKVSEPTISGKATSRFQRAFEFPLSGTGPWRVRLTRLTADSGSNFLANNLNWDSIVEVDDEKYYYPNTALIGLSFDADEFESIPRISFDLYGLIVDVPRNYNAETKQYDGLWDGRFKTSYTDNPVWLLRSLVYSERFGAKRFNPFIEMDKWSAFEAARYCDELVPDGKGGTEARYTLNHYLENPGSALEVLKSIAATARCQIYEQEGFLHLMQDRPGDVAQVFSKSNVVVEYDNEGRMTSPPFTYSSSARTARKNVCRVSYDNPEDNYNSTLIEVRDESAIKRHGYNPVEIRALGATRVGQAFRAGRSRVFTDVHQADAVTFRAAAEALHSGLGDVIQVWDPLKQLDSEGASGRIIATDGLTLTLDRKFDFVAGQTYTLTCPALRGTDFRLPSTDGQIRTRPSLESARIASTAVVDGRSVVTLARNVTAQRGALWMLTKATHEKHLWRIVSINEERGTTKPLTYRINAVQYRPAKYDYIDENVLVLPPPAVTSIPGTTAIGDLTARLAYTNKSINIRVAWSEPSAAEGISNWVSGYQFQWRSSDAGQWSDIGFSRPNRVEIPLNDFDIDATYEVRVAMVDRLKRRGAWTEAEVQSLEPIPDLSNPACGASIRHVNNPDGSHLLNIDHGNCSLPERVTGYRIWAKAINVPTVIPGVKPPDSDGWYLMRDVIGIDGYWSIPFHAPGDYQIRVAFNSAVFGEEPSGFLYDNVDRAEIVPPTPSNFTVVQAEDRRLKRFSWDLPVSTYGAWDQSVVSDVVGYEIRYKKGPPIPGDNAKSWDLGIILDSGAVSAGRQWFETSLLHSGVWTVMLKSVDATQWRSDEPAFVVVNIGDPPVQNAAETYVINQTSWPGVYENCRRVRVSGSRYKLEQIDVTRPAYYSWQIANNYGRCGLIIKTETPSTLEHRIRALLGDDIQLATQALGPIRQQNSGNINLEQKDFSRSLAQQGISVWHPYGPLEELTADSYQVRTMFLSQDGETKATLEEIEVTLDYPDVVKYLDDVRISNSQAGTTVPVTGFRRIQTVTVSLQDTGTGAINTLITEKTPSSVTLHCVNSQGQRVAGLVDLQVKGY